MFLKKSTKTSKGATYSSYALAQSYREGGKVKHKHIASLGKLTPEQAQQIKLILRTRELDNIYVGNGKDLVVQKQYHYLDIAVLHNIWKEYELDRFFSGFPYAEALVIYCCLGPASLGVEGWVGSTVLPRLLGVEFPGIGEARGTLGLMDRRETALQKHLYQLYLKAGISPGPYRIHRLTFKGREGPGELLSPGERSGEHLPGPGEPVTALVLTMGGYPFYWEEMPGNKQDKDINREISGKVRELFGLRDYSLPCRVDRDKGPPGCRTGLESVMGTSPGLALPEILGLPPEKRIKAWLAAGVLAYLLLVTLEARTVQNKPCLGGRAILTILGTCKLNLIGPKKTKSPWESITKVTGEQAGYLEQLGMEYLVEAGGWGEE